MLDLHENLKERLIAALTHALPLVELSHGKFLKTESRLPLFPLDQALPDHGPLRERLSNYIDPDFPLMNFVYDSLQYELLVREYLTESQKLTELADFNDAAAQATRIVSEFQSLPWRYALCIGLPHEVSQLLAKVVIDESLGPNIRLVKANAAFSEKFPLNHPDRKRHESIHVGSLLFPVEDNVSYGEDAVYLQVETEGFIGPYGGSAPAIQAERLLKAFLGLSLALRLLKIGDIFSPSTPKQSIYVHKAEKDSWSIFAKIDLARDAARVLGEMLPSDMLSQRPEEHQLGLLRLIISEMKAVFSAGAKGETIMLGAEWLLESYCAQDSRLSYVQSMVVLEVLLGDKAMADAIGLGQLLRNRCAYLIGKSHEERHALLKDFDEIYAVRSQIVHRGKARLNFKERLLFGKLQDICNRVIQREVDLLRAK